MKRFVVLSVCLLLLGAATANADLLGTTTAGTIGVSYTWDSKNAAYDLVNIYAKTFGGEAAGSNLLLVEGPWTATGGQFLVHAGPATNATYQAYTASTNLSLGAYSGVNFSTVNGSAVWARQSGTVGTVTNLIQGGWYTASGSGEEISPTNTADNDFAGYPENMIAQLKVTKGTTMITFGGGQNDKFGYSYNQGTTQVTAFAVQNIVPEPSTIALLGCGLFGLLAYAWRKRK